MRALKCFAVPALLVCLVPLCAQSAADQQTLADLKTASRHMNLEQPSGSPFHLQGIIEATDYLGQSLESAHWVEDYSSRSLRHRTVTKDGIARQVASEQSDDSGLHPSYIQQYLIDAVIEPGPSEEVLEQSQITYKSEKIGDVSLRCVVLQPKVGDHGGKSIASVALGPLFARAYCLAANAPVIRLAQLQFGFLVSYNGLTRMGARLYAKDISVSQFGKNRGRVRVEAMVPAPETEQADEAAATAGTGTGSGSQPVKLEAAVAGERVIRKVTPEFPSIAKLHHASGTVYLSVLIDEQGKVAATEVISAPSRELAESAQEAVGRWQYQPYLLNGTPTKVETVATVNYTYAGG